MSHQRFWMIYGDGQRAPAYKHSTEESASAEAKRLARLNPEVTFYILEAVEAVFKRDIATVSLRGKSSADDELPF